MRCCCTGRHFCHQERLSSQSLAQVGAEQRHRPRWEKRQEQEVELKGSLACLWLFFKEAFLVDQSKGSTEQLWNGILHFSLRFCGECFALRSSSRVDFALMMLNAGNILWTHNSCFFPVFFWNVIIKTWTFNLVLTLNKCFEFWKHCTDCMNALESVKGTAKMMF